MSRTYLKSISLLPPKVCATVQDATSAVVNLAELPEGELTLELHARKTVAESGHTCTSKWMEGDAVGGPFEDSGLVFTAIGELAEGEDPGIHDPVPLDRAVRAQFGYFVGTPAGTLPAIPLAVSILAHRTFAS
jgi:hypothetical protein